MHFEILVEDVSGEKMLEALVPKIIGAERHTVKIHPHKGVDALLAKLPMLLAGFGRTHAGYPKDYPAAVVVVCDLDRKNKREFVAKLESIVGAIEREKPDAHFCLAIEEGEAWLLGDQAAIRAAYPEADEGVLAKYRQDSICGTWELLADALYLGGHEALLAKDYGTVGAEKYQWAAKIAPLVEVGRNVSPSFGRFRKCLEDLAANAR
jgi:hypothetical protein